MPWGIDDDDDDYGGDYYLQTLSLYKVFLQ